MDGEILAPWTEASQMQEGHVRRGRANLCFGGAFFRKMFLTCRRSFKNKSHGICENLGFPVYSGAEMERATAAPIPLFHKRGGP